MKPFAKCHGRLFASVASLLLGVPAFAGTPLHNPNADEVYFLQQEYAHTTPDLNNLAQTFISVQMANEFQHQSATDLVVAQLKQEEASVQGVKTIIVDLNSTFSPYDSVYDEYDLDISDGTYISYQAFGNPVQIDLTNGTDAQSWSLKPDVAQKVLSATGNERYVVLALKLQLENSPPGVDEQPLVLNAKILSYDILSQGSGMRLGHVDVSSTGGN